MSDIHDAIWLELRDRIDAILPSGFNLQNRDLLYHIEIVGPAGYQALIYGIQIMTGSNSVMVGYTEHMLRIWRLNHLNKLWYNHANYEYASPNCLQAVVDRTALLIRNWQLWIDALYNGSKRSHA